MSTKDAVLNKLSEMGIDYAFMEHPPAYTIEEMDEMGITQRGYVCKNLFLRDAKGDRHFLVALDKDKKADLKSIQQQLGCTRLSFGSEERLYRCLKLTKGSVTLLGILNDPEAQVEVVLDSDLAGQGKIGVHPNENTATVWLSYDDLMKIIKQNGNAVHFVTI